MKIPSVEHEVVYPPFTCSAARSWPPSGNSLLRCDAKYVTHQGRLSDDGPNHSNTLAQKAQFGSFTPFGKKTRTRASPPNFLQTSFTDPCSYPSHTVFFNARRSNCAPVVASRSAAASSSRVGSHACHCPVGDAHRLFARLTSSPRTRGNICFYVRKNSAELKKQTLP